MFGFFNSSCSLDESGLLKGFVDNHSHVLYGVDDGVRTLEESLKILTLMEEAGVRKLWCTPHIMEDVPNKTQDLKDRFEQLKEAWKGSVELELASENMLDNLFVERLAKKDFLLHGENKLLVETSTWAAPLDFWNIIDNILDAGYIPVIAHPERFGYMKMEDYSRLMEKGALLQMNLASIIGVYGEAVAKRAQNMLSKGMYSMTGTDCHRFRALEGQIACKILSKSTVSMLSKIMTL